MNTRVGSPRIMIWGAALDDVERVRAQLPPDWHIGLVVGRMRPVAISLADCVIVVPPVLAVAREWEATVASILAQPGGPSMVTVGGHRRLSPTLVARLRRATTVALPDELPSVVARTRVVRAMDALVTLVAADRRSTSQLRRILREVSIHPMPAPHVSAVAAACSCHRATIAREWRTALGAGIALPRSIQEYLGWRLVLHAAALARGDRKRGWVYDQLGTTESRLARQAMRLAGLRLRELWWHEAGLAFSRFDERVVTPLRAVRDRMSANATE